MNLTIGTLLRVSFLKALAVIAATAFFVAGCASMETSGGSSGGSSGGGINLPGGSSGGSSGDSSGGSSGSSGGAGSTGPMDSVEIPAGEGGSAGDCGDDGVVGGGIGGGMGCEDSGKAGDVGTFPGGDPERADQLGKELEESVGDFDEVLMEEQREIETVSRNTEGYGTGSGRSGGNISLGEQAAGAQGGASGGSSGGGGGGGAASRADPLEGMSESDIEKRTPDDIAVIMDDDIVAKQLREAALAEDDPQLRERLWEEYRKYKGM